MTVQFKRYYNRMFLNSVREAIYSYKMIKAGDDVAVGLSGGKDSIALLFILDIIRKYSPLKFNLYGINIDMGLGMDTSPLEAYCGQNSIPLVIEHTNIGEVIFKDRREKNPCSLCSTLRRGALSRVASSAGINKIALGHSSDDVIQTLFMNVLCVGKLGTFSPMIPYEGKDLAVIRPMVYLKESTIKKIVSMESLPVIESPCPAAGKTTRNTMKELLFKLEAQFPDAQEKIITSLENIDFKNVWKQRK
jgi:tRNA(Ile)-lysidine synthase TilS/MesJ